MNKDFIKELQELDASYRFRIFAPTFVENEQTGKLRQISSGTIVCDIFDRTTGVEYANAKGLTEPEALRAAIDKARITPKPLTPAQKVDAAKRQQIMDESAAKLSEKDREIEALKAKLAEAEAKRVESDSKRK